MNKKLEYYLPYLVGQTFYRGGTPDENLIGFIIHPSQITLYYADGDAHIFELGKKISHLPNLRYLSDMTEEEVIEYLAFRQEVMGSSPLKFESISESKSGIWYHIGHIRQFLHFVDMTERSPEFTRFLAEKGFDVFRLIDVGLAHNKTEDL